MEAIGAALVAARDFGGIVAAKKSVKTVEVAYVVVYKDEAGEWRWKALAGNRKTVADSGEGYRNRTYAARVAQDLHPGAELEWGPR